MVDCLFPQIYSISSLLCFPICLQIILFSSLLTVLCILLYLLSYVLFHLQLLVFSHFLAKGLSILFINKSTQFHRYFFFLLVPTCFIYFWSIFYSFLLLFLACGLFFFLSSLKYKIRLFEIFLFLNVGISCYSFFS